MTPDLKRSLLVPRRPRLARFIILALLAPVALALFSAWLGRENVASDATRQQARATFDRSLQAHMLIDRLTATESSERGYIITGDAGFLAQYASARQNLLATFDQLERALLAKPAERKRLVALRDLAERKFAEMDLVIDKRRTEGLGSAAVLVKTKTDATLMEQIRVDSAKILEIAEQARNDSADIYRRRIYADTLGVWIGVGVIGLSMLGVAVLIWRQRMAQYLARLDAYRLAEWNRAILHSTADAIVILSPSGTIETINSAAAAMTGYLPEELVHQDVSIFMSLPDPPVPFQERIGLIDGQLLEAYLPDRVVPHRDGHEIPVDVSLRLMRFPDGDYVIASVHDISAHKLAERLKDELISTVSHELRTPLTSVVGALGLLRSGATGKMAAAPAHLIEIAENNSRRLIRLINDMLDIDGMQSGQLKLDQQPVDLRDIATRACEGSQGVAKAAHVEIICDLPDTPILVSGDADRLLQVISNLASNAIGVSAPSGAIRISTSSTSDGMALVTVDDDGPGVPTEFRDRIFGRFERAASQQGAGTGLGLAISRDIVVRHGGRIWFEDRPGGGTRFAFTLDLLQAGSATADAAYPRRAAS